MRPLKVAFLVGYHHRFTGSQRSLYLLVRALPPRVEPLCLFPGEGYATRKFREAGLPVRVVEAPAPLVRFGGSLLRAGLIENARIVATAILPYSVALARTLRRERVDLLHCNDPRALLMAAPVARLLRIPVVFHVRGELRFMGTPKVELSGLLSDRLIFVSEAVKDTFPARWRRKLRTVYNGIDPPPPPSRTRAALLAGLGLPDDGMLVVAVGSLVRFKGIHHLIAAVAREPRARLVLVGDKPDAAYGRLLDELAAPLGGRVAFAGWDEQAGDWHAAADVVCLPTIQEETLTVEGVAGRVVHTEGFSRTVLEAMAHGRPVIATRVAGAPEQVVDGVTGLLVPPSDPDALARALATLAGDAPLRARMGAAGAARVRERFSVARAVAGTVAVFDELVGGL